MKIGIVGMNKTLCKEEFTSCEIVQENKQLQNNWNELKEWLEDEKPTKDMNENFIMIRLSDLKNKMQELESRK